jgi:hypothetical protein
MLSLKFREVFSKARVTSVLIPLFSLPVWGLEPMNPVALCNRMIQEKTKKDCEVKAQSLKLDWYAATACNALLDDQKFLKCWQDIANGEFNPEAVSRCVEDPENNDDSILKCIKVLKDNRMPASARPYQTLKKK